MSKVEVVPRDVLREFMEQRDWNTIDGDFAEVGVWEGHSARVLVDFCSEGKILFLYDTFDGLPYHDSEFDNHHVTGEMVTSIDIVTEMLKDFADKIKILPGVFPQSASAQLNREFCFVNIDVDLYKATKDCLEFFYPRLVKGGVLIIQDDYDFVNTEGVTLAADAFLKDKVEVWDRYRNLAYFVKK